jgi:hypothetical protein
MQALKDCECLSRISAATVDSGASYCMVVNLRRGYPDTVLAEKLLLHCCNPLSLLHLVVRLRYHQVVKRGGYRPPYNLHTNTTNK